MRVLAYELKKLLLAPAIIGFAVLCLALNAIIVLASYNSYYDGLDPNTAGYTDIFDGYETEWIAQKYIGRYGLSGVNAENVRAKYETLQPIVDKKSAHGDSLSPYFGDGTKYLHKLLFRNIFGLIAIESALIALFAALLSTGYENLHNTEGVVCASRTGRSILRQKLLASLTAAAAFFTIILGVTLTLYFLRFDYSAVWGDNVSSLFNSAVGDAFKPFITWQSLTVAQLVWRCAAMAAGLAACFSLLGFAAGVFVRSSYGAAIASVALCALMFVAEPLFPYGGTARNLMNLSPVQLIVNIGDWFTDGYADILWRGFETKGLALSLALLAAASLLAAHHYRRRDLA
jgi:hypothetical protein